ncbi:MAG: sulfite exporter TauE/SafE family protein [Candidatus Omnitrophica bacterium]|nr:sulfite exporter TauE/SafE family protein [Candidatus Omnitrophota bacterium]
MSDKNEAVYDWTSYVKIGLVVAVVLLAFVAMFSPSKTAAPAAQSMQLSLGGQQSILAALPQAIGQPAAGPTVIPDQPFWILVATGFLIGCYGTIVGIGGGPIILPLLVFFYGWENELLVATSLFIVFLNAGSGCLGYSMQKRIDYKGGLQFTLAAMPGALISSFTHHLVNLSFFNVIFGVFLIFLSVYTIFSVGRVDKTDAQEQELLKVAKAEGYRRVRFTDSFGVKYDFYSNDKLGIAMNLLLGFFCGFLGIGGGVFQVPILIFLLRYPSHIATATSHFVTLLTCAIALLPHVFLGNVCYGEAMWMGVGVIAGAQLGARIAPKLNTKVTLYLFVVILVVLAIKLFFV